MLIFLAALSVFNSAALLFIAFVFYRKSQIRLIQKPTQDLAEFLADTKLFGYGVVRIDPDSLMMRSPR